MLQYFYGDKIMNKYKVVVYAIAKNEAKFAEAWAKNMSEADEIYVLLDPTSSDNTKEILEANGVKVKEKLIKPWRFDRARNESLKLVPKDADICVCTDLDELFDPGWRQVLEEKWTPETNQGVYKFWNNAKVPDQIPNYFDNAKIHDRKSFVWKWIIHEFIVPKNPEQQINKVKLDGILLKHYPDSTKPRSYKKLLEKAVKKEKKDTRYLSLLAEEYIVAHEYDNVEKTCFQLLKVKNANIADTCLAYKCLIQSAIAQKNYKQAKKWCYEGLKKCDSCRIFYGDLGQLLITQFNDSELGIALIKKCMSIENDVIAAREHEWKNPAYNNNLISIGYYNLKDYANALMYVDIAIQQDPQIESYKQNRELYINVYNGD